MPTRPEINRSKLIDSITDVMNQATTLSFSGLVNLAFENEIPKEDGEAYDTLMNWSIDNDEKLNPQNNWGEHNLSEAKKPEESTESEEIEDFCVVCGCWNELDSDYCCPGCDVSELEEDD